MLLLPYFFIYIYITGYGYCEDFSWAVLKEEVNVVVYGKKSSRVLAWQAYSMFLLQGTLDKINWKHEQQRVDYVLSIFFF